MWSRHMNLPFRNALPAFAPYTDAIAFESATELRSSVFAAAGNALSRRPRRWWRSSPAPRVAEQVVERNTQVCGRWSCRCGVHRMCHGVRHGVPLGVRRRGDSGNDDNAGDDDRGERCEDRAGETQMDSFRDSCLDRYLTRCVRSPASTGSNAVSARGEEPNDERGAGSAERVRVRSRCSPGFARPLRP